MKNIYLLLFSLLSLSLVAQDQLLNDDPGSEAEFSTAINPLDSSNIVLATITISSSLETSTVKIYYSHDFGQTWLISDFNGTVNANQLSGDPVLAFDALGNVYLVDLVGGPGFSYVKALYSKSSNGGAAWTVEHLASFAISDKPWLAVDRYENSPNLGNIYVPIVENTLNLYAFDSAMSNENYEVMSNFGGHLPSVVVRKDGMVFTSFVNLDDPNEVFVQQYDNGGTNLIHTTSVVNFPDYTFSAYEVSQRFQPTVYLAIDNSGGAYDGRLYISYTASESINPSKFDVFLTYSDDNGMTWSTPSSVSGTADDGIQQFYSSLFVNDIGTLIVDWYDRENFDSNSYMTDFYAGVSVDGGESFSKLLLSSASSDFNQVIPAGEGFGVGEYHQLVATDNIGISFWSDGRTNDGDMNIYMAKYNLNDLTSVEEFSIVSSNYSFSSLYPVPSLNRVNTDLSIKKSTEVQYTIINEKGQELFTSPWKNYTVGDHQLTIDFELPAGIYFVQLKTNDGYFKTMKWIRQ